MTFVCDIVNGLGTAARIHTHTLAPLILHCRDSPTNYYARATRQSVIPPVPFDAKQSRI